MGDRTKVAPYTKLNGSDFVAPTAPKEQACIVVFGDGGTGKSTLVASYAPDPIAYINFDKRADFAIAEGLRRGKKIHYLPIGYPANISKLTDADARKMGNAAVSKVIRNVEIAVRESQKGNVRTICLDTGTEYGEMLKLAFAGRIDKVDDFGKSKDLINREIWRLYHLAREGNAHLVVLGRAQPEPWVDKNPTGKYKFRGNETFIDGCDWAANIRIAKPRNAKAKRVFKIEMEVTKAGIDGSQLGEIYTEDEWGDFGPFVWACMESYPGTDPSTWS